MFQAWRTFFCSDKLVLREFLGSHWSRQVFLHLVTSDTLHPDIRQLVLQSNEVNQERLCFLLVILRQGCTHLASLAISPSASSS